MRFLAALVLLVGCGSEAAAPPTAAEPVAEGPVEAPAPEPPADWVDVDASTIASSLRDHPGRYLLVNVWSTWCEPCVEEMPELIETARGYEGRGLALVLVSTDPPTNRDAAHALLARLGAPMPSWFKVGSDDAFIRAVHEDWSGGLPATLLLDEQRRVVQFWEEPVSAEMLRAPIESLLNGGTG
ncbi:MAG: TlpA family protein disulfide reductase [Sandaracinaceae bacterium]|nr:TlpA family protein disulfide reductase [Sandaracinaceae bacterium]